MLCSPRNRKGIKFASMYRIKSSTRFRSLRWLGHMYCTLRAYPSFRGVWRITAGCRLAVDRIDFIEITLEVRVIILDACMQVDVRKEREEISMNRSSESGEFYRFSSIDSVQYAQRRKLGCATRVRLRIKERLLLFELSLTFPVLYCIFQVN
jgi:hypothetical protein